MAAIEKEILQIDIAINTKDAVREVIRMERDFQRSVVNVGKAWGGVGKAIMDVNRSAVDTINKQIENVRNFVQNGRKAREELRSQAEAYRQLQTEITTHTKLLEKLQATAKKADKEDPIHARVEKEKELVRLLKVRQALTLKDAVKAVGSRKAHGISSQQQKDREAQFKKNDKTIRKATERFETVSAPIKSIFRKDLPGAVKDSFKIMQKGIRSAPGILKTAHAMQIQGRMQGGFKGGMMGMGGGMLGKFGKILDFFGKLEPLFTLLSGSIAGLIKLLIDAEAAAKDFNREILTVASTSEVLLENGRRATLAHQDLKVTLKGIRDVSNNLWDNLAWGIDAKEYKSMFNVLTQEGVSIARIQKEAAQARKSVGEFSQDMVHVGVAYSRNFGVALNSVFELQAEMTTEMGYGLDNVEKSFYGMLQSAQEAGIASNKFFAMIRNVSSDLALYNTRLDDAVKLLGKLGTVMSPRNASKFLQTVIQSVKGMGRIGRLQMDMLSGGRMGGEILRRDLDRRTSGIAEQLGVSTTDVMHRNIEDLLQSVDQSKRGDLREALISIRTDRDMMGKGQYGRALAARNLSAGASIQAVRDGLLGLTGRNTSIAEARGTMAFEQLAEAQGWSEEMVDGLLKMEYAFEQHREALKRQFDDPAVQARLQKVFGAEIKTVADVDKLGFDQLMDTMTEEEQKSIEGMNQVRDYAKEMSDYTSDVSKKLDTLMQFIMNQIYNVLVGIFDMIEAIVPGSAAKKAKERRDAAEASMASGNVDIQAAFSRNKETYDARHDFLMNTGTGKTIRSFLEKGEGANYDNIVSGMVKHSVGNDPETIVSAGKAAGLDHVTATKLWMALKDGGNLEGVWQGMGLGEDQMKEFVKQLPHWMKMGDMARFVKDFQVVSEDWVPPSIEDFMAGLHGPITNAPAASPVQETPVIKASPGFVPSAPTEDKTPVEAMEEQRDSITYGFADVVKALRVQGIKMDSSFLEGPYEKAIKDAASESLFEYFMYSKLSPTSFLGKSFNPKTIGSGMVNAMRGGMDPSVYVQQLPANSKGGLVLQPAPGEVIASVAPGERILPKGASAGGDVKVTLELKDDLKRFIRAEAHNAIYEDRLRNRR